MAQRHRVAEPGPRGHLVHTLPGGDCAPATYADFLWRSSVALWHEPSAWRRAAGARPRR